MIRLLRKTFILLLFVTFSSVWVSDAFAMLSNDKKYGFYEQAEKNTEENNLENETKTLFLAIIENISSLIYSTFENNNISSSELFRVKEFTLKNATPPPKHVYPITLSLKINHYELKVHSFAWQT